MDAIPFGILLILLLSTRVGSELAQRSGQPALVGEILAGVALGFVAGSGGWIDREAVIVMAEFGMFLLMLLGGAEMTPRRMVEASGPAVAVAVGGMLLPLALGFGLGWLFLPESSWKLAQSLFVGVSLAVTAVPVAIKVLKDLGRLQSRIGQTVVAAAVFDDIFSLLLLALLTGLMRTGETPGAEELLLLLGKVSLFFAVTVGFGVYGVPWLGRLLGKVIAEEFPLSTLIILGLGYALLAETLGMHFIIGAFLAGLFFRRRTATAAIYEDVSGKLSGLTAGFFAPVFFAYIGLHMEPAAVSAIPLFTGLILLLALAGKVVGAAAAARAAGLSTGESLSVGTAMSARGAVELVIAGVALEAGLFDRPADPPPEVRYLFSATVVMAISTTVLAPIGLRYLIGRIDAENAAPGK